MRQRARDLRDARGRLHAPAPRRARPIARGKFLGLTTPQVLDHLKSLGVTTLELLPVHAFVDDRPLVQRGSSNYWGYNTIGFFAPDPRYGVHRDPVHRVQDDGEGRCTAAGIEVILDVVYNHTAEGSETGPTLSLPRHRQRALLPAGRGRSATTPTSPAAATRSTCATRACCSWSSTRCATGSTEMHVDGFRFDLATTLARAAHGFDALVAVLRRRAARTRCSPSVKLIAEPWDLGEGGYQVGDFPPGWAEWNDKYRDTMRALLDAATPACSATSRAAHRLAPTSTAATARRPVRERQLRHRARRLHAARPRLATTASTTRPTARTTATATDNNRSWNCGAEGPTDDPAIRALRERPAAQLPRRRCCCRRACR